MKRILMFAALMISATVFAQSVNDYKYALVPAKFEFQKEADQYKLNTHAKMFMQKYGFETWLDSEPIPQEVANSNCNKVYVDILENSNMFVTKLKVVLKDCSNNVLFTSTEGQSREKDYKTAYTQALRQAFTSFDALNHKYNGKDTKEAIVEKKDAEPVNVNAIQKVANEKPGIVLFPDTKLMAISANHGYDLVHVNDSEAGKKVMQLFITSQKNCFIAEMNDRHGVMIDKDGQWIFEYYSDGKLVSQQMEIPNLKRE